MTTSNHLDHIDQARYQVSQFLNDPLERVMVIRGSYGSGKSYFLREDYLANNRMPEDSPKWLAYTSVFGVNSIKELQSTIAGSLEGRSDNKIARGKHQQAAKLDIGLSVLQKVLKPFIGGVNIELSATSLIWAIAKRAGMLLVIDDIDRNSGSLKLNDLVGFVSSITEHSRGKTKAILVLHDDELEGEDKDTWAKLREKIVDREITFAPDIRSTASHYVKTPELKESISDIHFKLGSHNIRTMLKIESLVNRTIKFFQDHGVALHASEDLAVAYNASLFYLCKKDFTASDLGEASSNLFYPREKEHSEAVKLLLDHVTKLNYFASEEFAEICLQFFKTGTADINIVEAFKNDKFEREKKEKQDQIMSDFWRIYNGDFSDKEDEVIARADKLFSEDPVMLRVRDVSEITALVCLLGYPTQHLFKAWVSHHKNNQDVIQALANMSDIFPIELEPAQPTKVNSPLDLQREFLKALKVYHKDLNKFFSVNLLSELQTWTSNDFVDFFLSVEDPDLLVSIRSLLSVNWESSNIESMKQIVPNIKTALKQIAKRSKLNRRRVDHLISGKNTD